MQHLKDKLKSDIDKLEKIKNKIVRINSTYSTFTGADDKSTPSNMNYLKVLHDINTELNMFKIFYSTTMYDIVLSLSAVGEFSNNLDSTMKLSYLDGLKISTEELETIAEDLNRFIEVTKDFQSISEGMCDLYS